MQITLDQLSGLSLKELSELNSLVVNVIKSKRGLVGQQKANSLKVNQEIKINHKDHSETIFVIDKINRTKAVCHIKGSKFKSYNVPLDLIVSE